MKRWSGWVLAAAVCGAAGCGSEGIKVGTYTGDLENSPAKKYERQLKSGEIQPPADPTLKTKAAKRPGN